MFFAKLTLINFRLNYPKKLNFFICGICQEEQCIPKNGFEINNRLKNFMKIELNEFEPSQ